MNFKYLLQGALLMTILYGCSPDNDTIQGYIEADMVYAAPISSGRIENIKVSRGDILQKGDFMFSLETTEYIADVGVAEANLKQAKSELQDKLKGSRQEKLDALKADIGKLDAILRLAKIDYDRNTRLFQKNALAEKDYDTARLTYKEKEQSLAEAQWNLAVAELPARPDQIKAAEQTVKAAENDLIAAKWRLTQRRVESPSNAVVYDVLLRKGEVANTGTNVVSLIPFTNFKIRFFVNPQIANTIKTGQSIRVLPGNGAEEFQAKITYISQRPEYTPPVIYSKETSAKLVFMIEASVTAEQARKLELHPGLPVRVSLHQSEEK